MNVQSKQAKRKKPKKASELLKPNLPLTRVPSIQRTETQQPINQTQHYINTIRPDPLVCYEIEGGA